MCSFNIRNKSKNQRRIQEQSGKLLINKGEKAGLLNFYFVSIFPCPTECLKDDLFPRALKREDKDL